MNDSIIREAFKRKVLRRHLQCPKTRVVDELGLHRGASRIDIAVINGRLAGFEIKSERDSLARLPGQIRLFSSVLERISLIVTWRHVIAAMRAVPGWWGVTLVERGARGGISFSTLRPASTNPSPNSHALAALLWRDEALAILDSLGAARGVRGRSASVIYDRLVAVTKDHAALRDLICAQLRARTGWRSGDSSVSGDD